MHSYFASGQNAPVAQQGARFPVGSYLAQIHSVSISDRFKGPHFIVEFIVVESSNPNCPPGTQVGWAQPLITKFGSDGPHGRIKAFWLAVGGKQANDQAATDALNSIYVRLGDAATSTANPCAGMVVHVEAYSKPPKKDSPPGTQPFVELRFAQSPRGEGPQQWDRILNAANAHVHAQAPATGYYNRPVPAGPAAGPPQTYQPQTYQGQQVVPSPYAPQPAPAGVPQGYAPPVHAGPSAGPPQGFAAPAGPPQGFAAPLLAPAPPALTVGSPVPGFPGFVIGPQGYPVPAGQ